METDTDVADGVSAAEPQEQNQQVQNSSAEVEYSIDQGEAELMVTKKKTAEKPKKKKVVETNQKQVGNTKKNGPSKSNAGKEQELRQAGGSTENQHLTAPRAKPTFIVKLRIASGEKLQAVLDKVNGIDTAGHAANEVGGHDAGHDAANDVRSESEKEHDIADDSSKTTPQEASKSSSALPLKPKPSGIGGQEEVGAESKARTKAGAMPLPPRSTITAPIAHKLQKDGQPTVAQMRSDLKRWGCTRRLQDLSKAVLYLSDMGDRDEGSRRLLY